MNPKIASERRYKATQVRIHEGEHPYVNVGQTERQASMIGGGLLVFFGLLHGSSSGLLMGLVGAGLFYRGYTGHCHLYDATGQNTAKSSGQSRGQSAQLQHAG